MPSRIVSSFCITDGHKFRLKDFDSDETLGFKSKEHAEKTLESDVERLRKLQERLYAEDRWGVLLIFQGMDASGKDSAVEHVMSGVNPQGCEVHSFKTPSEEELDHDFMWRTMRRLPERGRIGIFNRSYYEEVLVVRVHAEILARQKIPPELVGKKIWEQRCADIKAFEDYFTRNGYVVRKFFLNVSKKEQKRRFLARLDEPAKNWKFSAGDVNERGHWRDYMRAYEEMICQTSSRNAPWYVVPADHKWFARMVVAGVVVDALESLDLKFPKLSEAKLQELRAVRQALGQPSA